MIPMPRHFSWVSTVCRVPERRFWYDLLWFRVVPILDGECPDEVQNSRCVTFAGIDAAANPPLSAILASDRDSLARRHLSHARRSGRLGGIASRQSTPTASWSTVDARSPAGREGVRSLARQRTHGHTAVRQIRVLGPGRSRARVEVGGRQSGRGTEDQGGDL